MAEQPHYDQLLSAIADLTSENEKLRQDLNELKSQVENLRGRHSGDPSVPPTRSFSTTRRRMLQQFGAFLAGSAIIGTASVLGDTRTTQARMVVHPTFNNFTARVGTFITPPGGGDPENSLPGSTLYGLIATGEISPLNASGLPGTTTNPGTNHGIIGISSKGYGVYGSSDNTGVYGNSLVSTGVFGNSTASQGYGVYGNSANGTGVFGNNTDSQGYGVYGNSPNGTGVFGNSSVTQGYGVYGNTVSGSGVFGNSTSGPGVFGNSTSDTGVKGNSESGYGVVAQSTSGVPFSIVALGSASSIPDGKNIGDMYVDVNGVLYIWYRTTNISQPQWTKVSAT